jgi:ribosomal protein S18 acetylase RimI-like enzyme
MSAASNVACAPMTAATRDDARRLLAAFLEGDDHYRASAAEYGHGGAEALERALDLLLAPPEVGFVWLAFVDGRAKAACVVCYAISTSRGALVAKLDDVTVDAACVGQGIGTRMLDALARHLADRGVGRIDTACHRENQGAWRFYARLGFRPLDEERLARVL